MLAGEDPARPNLNPFVSWKRVLEPGLREIYYGGRNPEAVIELILCTLNFREVEPPPEV